MTNALYVTYNDPLPNTPLYHTVVHTGCVWASGFGPAEQDVFDAIWRKFETLSIPKVELVNGKVVEKDVMTYYGKEASATKKDDINALLAALEVGGTISSTQKATLARELFLEGYALNGETKSLLQFQDGVCGSWQIFMADVLAVQGICVALLDIETVDDTKGFKVYSTARGQGGVKPGENIWSDHSVVEYNGKVYDPSYGVDYGPKANALEEFVRKSVEYVGVFRNATAQEKQDFGHGGVLVVTTTTINTNDFRWRVI